MKRAKKPRPVLNWDHGGERIVKRHNKHFCDDRCKFAYFLSHRLKTRVEAIGYFGAERT